MSLKTKAFTLLEVLLALVLASILTVGSVKVIENMQRETDRFRRQVDNDMTWLAANHHLAKNVRASSHLENPDANTLVLRDYHNNEIGRYIYNSGTDRLEYWTTNGTILQQSFPHVAANFSLKPGAQRNGQFIETIVNYTGPFANVLYLRCLADVAGGTSTIDDETGGNTWGLYFLSWSSFNSVITTLDGYVAVGIANMGTSRGDAFIVKTDKNGNILWSRVFHTNDISTFESVQETTDAAGAPDGYVAIGATGTNVLVSGKVYWRWDFYVIRLNMAGNVVWSRKYYYHGINIQDDGHGIKQLFNSSGAPDGFIMAGFTSQSSFVTPNPTKSDVLLVRIDNNGGLLWSKRLWTADYENAKGIELVLNGINGSAIGFIITVNNQSDIVAIRTDTSGNVLWSKHISNTGGSYYGTVKQAFTANGAPDGFIIAGSWTGSLSYMSRLDDSGSNITWAKWYIISQYGAAGGFQTFDKFGKADGFAFLNRHTYNSEGTVMRTYSDGMLKWSGSSLPGTKWAYCCQSFDSARKPDGYIAVSQDNPARMIKMDRKGIAPDTITLAPVPAKTNLSIGGSVDLSAATDVELNIENIYKQATSGL